MNPGPAVDEAIVALSHPARRELIRLCGERERSAGDLGEAVGLRQPATSQHLRVLRDAGLVIARQDGNRRLYRVDFERLASIRAALDELWGTGLPRLRRAAEERARSQRGVRPE
jgi:DNA-binding transcriptional ArsR family regulator